MIVDRPTVTAVVPLVHELYARRGGECCLHTVLGDLNVRDSDVRFVACQALQREHADCLCVALALYEMTRSQRHRVAYRV